MAVPIIDDAERRTSYAPSSATTIFSVGFPIFDLADVIVEVDAVEIDAGTYTVTGTLVDGAYDDAIVTLDDPVSGVALDVVGRRPPARTDNFTEGNRIPVRDFNIALSKLVAITRELYDRLQRVDPNIENAADLADQVAAAVTEAESFSKRGIIAVTGTAHTFAVSDINKILDFTNAGTAIGTIPAEADEPWEPGDQIDIRRADGLVQIATALGVTVTSPNNYTDLPTQYGMATLIYLGSDVWQLTGGLG